MCRVMLLGLFVIVLVSVGVYGEQTEEMLTRSFEQLMQPRTFETGTRSGQVVDAVTGAPVEGAVVVYTWDVRVFGLESRSQKAVQYEVTTNEDGRYFIPSQKTTVEGAIGPGLEPEYVYVYKNGYVWYRVFRNQPRCFIEYVTDLNQKYQKENNIVRLQPWIDELSHDEHVGIFDRLSPIGGPILQQALEKEMVLAKQERQASKGFKRKAREDLRKFKEFDDRAAIPALIEFLKKNIYRRSAFETAIASLSYRTGRSDLENTDVIPERFEIVKDLESWWGRNKNRGKEEWIADLVANGRNDKVKMEALNKLQYSGAGESATPYLVKLLSEEGKSAGMYESALRLLSQTGDKSAIAAIKPKLYHPDIYVRREAAMALNKLGDRSGIPIMIATLDSQSKNSRSVANAVLREITGQDFAGVKSLRYLSAPEEKAVLNKWIGWWKENKNASEADKVDFPKVLAGEEAAMQLRYAAMEKAEKNNPELPVFEDPDKSPKATFEQFRAALLKDDVEKALSLMCYPLKEKYKEIFEKFGVHRRDYARGLGKIYFESELSGVLYYDIVTEQDDGLFAFPVHFVQDVDGKWLITMI